MLIEFSVENHRAFRDRQTFSMVASGTAKTAHGHVAETGFGAVPLALHEACIFGANGSGKSSLIDAMAQMSKFVRTSFSAEAGSDIPVEPFVFHSEWATKPTEFEVVFIQGDTLYQYGFVISAERVWEEWLFARPKTTGRQRQIFMRTYDVKAKAYDWEISATHLKGERDSWKAQTRDKALFLSTAVQLNAEGLKEAFDWIVEGLHILLKTNSINTKKKALKGDWNKRILQFLKSADISLIEILAKEEDLFASIDFSKLSEKEQTNANALKDTLLRISPINTSVSIHTVRKNDLNHPVALKLEQESTGTQALFDLAGPILNALDKGLTLVIDELNTGLHPLAFQHLIALFCDPAANPHHAQLIFTTHDTSVTERDCIGRDQIWLVDKGDDLAAHLVPFSDYKTRDARGFQKGYLQGRFGAVPRLAN